MLTRFAMRLTGAPFPPHESNDLITEQSAQIDIGRCLLRTLQLHARQASSTPSAMHAVAEVSGGATVAALHLPGIAHECRIADNLFNVAEVFKRTPYIADLKPAGRFVAKDLFDGELSTVDEDIAAQWFHAWRLHDHSRVYHGQKPELCGLECRPGRCRCGRFFGATRGLCVGQLGREAWQRRGMAFGWGYDWKYAQQVGPARHSAAVHPGGVAEKACHADL
jgi:Dehydratase family